MTEFLIIGDGIAGLNMAWHLYKEGRSFKVVADQGPRSSTVAAGIINPVIGRKFNLSWRYDEIYYCLLEQYGSLPFGDTFIAMPVLRALKSVFDLNEFSLRENELRDFGYIAEDQDHKWEVEKYGLEVSRWIEVQKAGRLNTVNFVSESIAFFEERGFYHRAYISSKQIQKKKDRIEIDQYPSDYIIMAEGMPMPLRSLIPDLPVVPQKGEILLFETDVLPNNFILKHKYFVVPLGGTRFWLGSNYDWDSEDYMLPSKEQYLLMTQFLDEICGNNYTVIAHRMGYRPTIKDRMPIVGRSTSLSNTFVLNGMGSKGASLAPYCSRLLLNHITKAEDIPREININRFRK